jgi:hypothetical protein
MKNHRRQAIFLLFLCVLVFSDSVKAVSLGDFNRQPPVGASMWHEEAGAAIKNVLPTPGVNAFNSPDAILVSPAPDLIRKRITKPNGSDYARAAIISIPTTWDDVTVMPIPTQWDDVKIIFVSAK